MKLTGELEKKGIIYVFSLFLFFFVCVILVLVFTYTTQMSILGMLCSSISVSP